jgi:hypothetical protein
MPISILQNPGIYQRQLTTQADGFIFWYNFAVNAAGNPTIFSALLGFIYDASRNEAINPERPTPGINSYRFSQTQNSYIDFSGAKLQPAAPRTGSPSRRCITAVCDFQADGGAMNGWLNSAAWTAGPPAAGYGAAFDPGGILGFHRQTVAWGGAERDAFRIEPADAMVAGVGPCLDSLGIIAPLHAAPMIQSFYNLLNGVVPPGAAAGAFVPALTLTIANPAGPVVFPIPAPVAFSGYAMIAHGVLAPGLNDPFLFADWTSLTAADLVRRLAEKSYSSPGPGAPPNDSPVEIIYLTGLAGMGLGTIPTY